MIGLSEQIEKLVLEEEQSSLKMYAKSWGVSEMDVINSVFDRFQAGVKEIQGIYQEGLKMDDVDHLIGREILNPVSIDGAESFFAYFKSIEKYYKQSCIETILTTLPAISKSPFFEGSNALMENSDLKIFLEEIPLINTFDKTRFDQNVLLEAGDRDIYVIRNYFLLDFLLTDYICPLFINIVVANKKLLAEKGYDFFHEKTVAGKLLEIFEKFKSGQIHTPESFNIWKEDDYFKQYSLPTTVYKLDLYYGLKYFSFFHEYAHIVLSHFTSSSANFKMELDADLLAINLLVTNTTDFYKKSDDAAGNMYKEVMTFRIVSPLVYFLFRIGFEDDNLSVSPSFITRFQQAKLIVDNLLILNSMQDMGLKLTAKIETIMLYVIEQKGIAFAKMSDLIAGELKIVQRDVLPFLYSKEKGFLYAVKKNQ